MEGNIMGFDNILSENEIETLFTSPEESVQDTEDSKDKKDSNEESEKNNTAETVDPESLFGGDVQLEGVGSEETEDKGNTDATSDNNEGASPNNNFYSSIAQAMAEDCIFPNLDADTVKKANDADSFSALFEAELNARLNETQKRIKAALDNGVEATDIRKYEGTLQYINSITDDQISAETTQGEQLRKNLIYQDFLNKGYSAAKAQKYTERAINAGTDVEDAREALQSNMEFFQAAYDKLLQEAETNSQIIKRNREKQATKLRDDLLKDKTLMGDIEISNDIRRKALDSVTKPIFKDPTTGNYMTALQKYESENHADFIKYVGLMFTLTDGFKDFDSFAKGKIKKGVRKGLQELEEKLNTSSRSTDGGFKMVTNAKTDPESYLSGARLDI